MKVIELSASNYKKIRALHITPDEHFNVLAGKNGSGKSTVTEIITSTLEGARSIEGEPITYGEDGGWTRVDLGELVAERKYSQGKTSLKVWGKDGVKYSNPQKVMDGLYGALGLDPTEFQNLAPKEQARVLRELANVDIDFDEIDALNKADYDARTVFNRDAKATEATINSLLPDIAGFDGKEVVLAEHLDQLQAAEKKVAELESLRNRYSTDLRMKESKISARTQIEKQIEDLKSQAEQITEEIVFVDKMLGDLEEEINNFKAPTPEKIQAKRDYIKNIEGHNEKVKTKKRVAELEAELADLYVESDKRTKAIEERSKQAAAAIAAANLPVSGLAFTADGVTYNGEPFAHLSDGQKLRISMAVAMAANPTIRVIITRKGYALDKDAMALLQQMASEHDYQLWVERIDPEPASIVIEDGAVVEG